MKKVSESIIMNRSSWWVVFLLLHVGVSSGFYHELSMETYKYPHSNYQSAPYFGYSITYMPSLKCLIVSAPKENYMGRVYEIDIDNKTITPVETPDILLNGKDNVNETYYLLGATVKAGHNFYIMCAPRYTVTDKGNLTRMMTIGKCFLKSIVGDIQNLADNTEFPTSGIEKTMTSYGWSVDATMNNIVLIGGPAMSKGRAREYTNVQSSSQKKPFHLETPNKASFNFGYSITHGNYFLESNTSLYYLYYAISTTYGSVGKGQVYFFDAATKRLMSYSIGVEYAGSLYGASLCTVYLGSTYGRDSLLVGAPAYIENTQDVNVGAVHVYLPAAKQTLAHIKIIKGKSYNAHFGSAMVNLGDMDGDVLPEVAIGAPYENEIGAVYIYRGADLKARGRGETKFIQKILPQEDKGLREFGFSLTALEDYDGNGCNELAVGVPGSNEAVLFRCFAYITINVYADFPTRVIQQNRENITFQSCIKVKYSDKPENIIAEIDIRVHVTHPNAKLITENNAGTLEYTEQLKRNQTIYCRDVYVHTPLLGNYDQLLSYRISASLHDDPRKNTVFDPDRVLLSKQSKLSLEGTESLADCNKSSGDCEPILTVSYKPSISNRYILGSPTNGSFAFNIHNEGDPAYTPCVLVKVTGAKVLKLPTADASSCSYKNGGVLCQSIIPILNGADWYTGDIKLDIDSLTSEDERITIAYTVYNHCSNETDFQGPFIETIDLLCSTDGINITHESVPDDVVNIYSEETQVNQRFTITNHGPTHWYGVSIAISVMKKENLQYYKNIVDVESEMACHITGETDDEVNVSCDILHLRSNQEIKILIPFQVTPLNGNSAGKIQEISSTLRLNLKNDLSISSKSVGIVATVQEEVSRPFIRDLLTPTTYKLKHNLDELLSVISVVTKLQYIMLTVPAWVFIIACLIGILIIILLAYALYELGILRRKKKTKLKNLKESVRRQSAYRQSMRHSRRNSDGQAESLISAHPTVPEETECQEHVEQEIK